MEERNKAAWVARYGMLVALAMIFSYIEAMIPVRLPVPGMKLGLANLVTMVGLYTVSVTGTAMVALVRILLVGFTFGNVQSMMYGLVGGVLSLGVMILCKKSNWLGTIGVSVAGGVFHNIGQLLVAVWITKNSGVFVYLPALLAGGCVAGVVIGTLGGLIAGRIRRFVS